MTQEDGTAWTGGKENRQCLKTWHPTVREQVPPQRLMRQRLGNLEPRAPSSKKR